MKKTYLAIVVGISALILAGCSGSKQTTAADTALDTNFFNQATNSGNLKQCDEILDKNLKQQCRDVINSLTLTSQAAQNLDLSICNKIALARAKDDCVNQVNSKIEAKNADAKQLAIAQNAVDKGDPNLCNQIADENQKASCKYNILAGQAIQKKDSSLCDKIDKKNFIDQCKKSIENNAKN